MALYTYESPEVGDLTFVEGDVVMVTEREGEWWRGCIGDQTGVFPSNYVRPVEPEVRELLQRQVNKIIDFFNVSLSYFTASVVRPVFYHRSSYSGVKTWSSSQEAW